MNTPDDSWPKSCDHALATIWGAKKERDQLRAENERLRAALVFIKENAEDAWSIMKASEALEDKE